MQYLEAVIDPMRISDIYQRFGVADFHQCRRMNVLVFFQHRVSLPQSFDLFFIIKLAWVIGLPQVDLHLCQSVPLPHVVHGARVTEAAGWNPPLAAPLGYIGNVMVRGWYLQMVFQVKIILLRCVYMCMRVGGRRLGGLKIL